MNNLKNKDQTQFAFEEPMFSDTNVNLPVDEKPVEQVQEKSSKKKIIIIGGAVAVVLLVFLAILFGSRAKTTTEVLEEEQMEISKDLSPMEERIENARIDLEIADPANQDLTFPPVDMELRLDKKEK